MLILFRHSQISRRVAFVMAFAFLFLAVIGELFHFVRHEGVSGTGTVVRLAAGTPTVLGIASVGPFEAADPCAICEWEKIPATAALWCVPFLMARLLLPRFARFAQKPLFLVRQIAALREARGPPCLAGI